MPDSPPARCSRSSRGRVSASRASGTVRGSWDGGAAPGRAPARGSSPARPIPEDSRAAVAIAARDSAAAAQSTSEAEENEEEEFPAAGDEKREGERRRWAETLARMRIAWDKVAAEHDSCRDAWALQDKENDANRRTEMVRQWKVDVGSAGLVSMRDHYRRRHEFFREDRAHQRAVDAERALWRQRARLKLEVVAGLLFH